MQSKPDMPIFIYDGDCAFCSTTVRILQKLMKRHPPMRPFQFINTEDYGLSKKECGEEVKFVSSGGKVFGGEAAFRTMFKEAGGVWWLVNVIMVTPIIKQLSGVVYRWVAKNRHNLPGGTPTCSLPREY